MYRGSEAMFDREQLIFVCEAALAAAFDRIESALPDTIPLAEYEQNKDSISSWVLAAKEVAGMFLAILWSRLNKDSMSGGDALRVCGMDEAVEAFVKERTDPGWPGMTSEDELVHPDCRPLAEKFVDAMFDDYLGRDRWSEPITLSDNGYIEPPDDEGTIRRRDVHGNCEEVRHMDDEDWQEWRDLFADDALYFQPEDAGDHDAGTSAATITSYQVYRDFANAKKAHPDCEIGGFIWDEIEKPTFLDVENPTFGHPDNQPDCRGWGR
jgi:hypothetical protein